MGTTGTFGSTTASSRNIGPSVSANNGGFQFTAPVNGTLTTVKLHASTITSGGNFTASLYTNNAGSPGTQVGSSTPAINITGAADITWTFGTPPSLTAATLYWIVISNSGASDVGFDTVANDASYGSGRNNTITSITTTGLTNTEDWRMQVSYTTAFTDSVTEAATATDANQGGFLISASVAEAAFATDASNRGFIISVSASEVAAAADSEASVGRIIVAVSEVASAADTAFATLKAAAAQAIRKVAPSLTSLRRNPPETILRSARDVSQIVLLGGTYNLDVANLVLPGEEHATPYLSLVALSTGTSVATFTSDGTRNVRLPPGHYQFQTFAAAGATYDARIVTDQTAPPIYGRTPRLGQ